MNSKRWSMRRPNGSVSAPQAGNTTDTEALDLHTAENGHNPNGEVDSFTDVESTVGVDNVVNLAHARAVTPVGPDEGTAPQVPDRTSATSAAGRVAARLGTAALHVAAILVAITFSPLSGESAAFLFGGLVIVVTAVGVTGSGSRSLRVADDVGLLIILTSVVTAALALIRPGTAEAHHFVRAGLLAAGLVLMVRWITFASRRALRRRHIGLEPTVIVGAGQVGKSVAAALLHHPEHGFHPIGFLDDPLGDGEELPLPLLGQPEKLAEIMRSTEARHVIIAFGTARETEIVRLLRDWDWQLGNVYILPRFFELRSHQRTPDSIDLRGYPLLRLRGPGRAQQSWPAKRVFDIAASGFLLLLVAPALAGCAAAVRFSGPGPILFRQERVGQDGRRFEILKFRTMPVNNDSDTTWNVERDNRLATTGRVLRRTHLDELPQLFNVLRGEMSVIGPRPERPFFVEQFEAEIAGYDARHRVPVGITGWAQVNGLFGNTSIEERSRFDNRYIDQWTLWGDFVILLRTIPTVFRRRRQH